MIRRAGPFIIAAAVALFVGACSNGRPIAEHAPGTGGSSTAGTVGASTPGTGGTGTAGTGGAGAAGTGGGGVAGMGNVGDGGTIGTGGRGAVAGTGGVTSNDRGPCDIYRDAGQPCVAAYSTVRRLLSTYIGPLYQIRTGSSDQNTGSGGATRDIGQTADGFADAAAVDAACAGTICTVSLLYDQSGRGSDLPVAKAGIMFAGPMGALDDFESSATKEPLTVGGHRVYSLYMEPRQGYRLARLGDGLPLRMDPQGVYMLADGTRAATGCCWEFGNGPTDAKTFYSQTALLFGGRSSVLAAGAGDGPWFMADASGDIWPGIERLSATPPPNAENPSLEVKFALGLLKTQPSAVMINRTDWALRMADVTTAGAVTTAYQGPMAGLVINAGSVILGIDGTNSNYSWGTFYEGAIVAGFPSDDTELAVLRNVQAVGYGK